MQSTPQPESAYDKNGKAGILEIIQAKERSENCGGCGRTFSKASLKKGACKSAGILLKINAGADFSGKSKGWPGKILNSKEYLTSDMALDERSLSFFIWHLPWHSRLDFALLIQ